MLAELRAKISSEVKEKEPLAPHTTYRIGGPADYFFAAPTGDDAVRAIQAAKELKMPYFVLGGGSNVLVSDNGYRGLVIKMVNRGVSVEGTKVKVEAGTPSAFVALRTTEAGLTGFEWAIGLPGTIGGAIRGNASMYGGETGRAVETVRCLRNGTVEELTREQCEFGYRDSIFKRHPNSLILSAVLALQAGGDVAAGQERLKEILRNKKQQQPIDFPTAGCIFKNWQPGSPEDLENVRRYLDLDPAEQVPLTMNGHIPAGWIIDRAQLKGTKVGGVRISDKHANFFINENGGRADDVIGLIALVKTKIRNMTHSVIQLQEEIEYLGF